MNLEIESFADAGNLSKERIVLRAKTDLDVGEYALLRSGVGPDDAVPLSGRKIAFWFPDEMLKANDLVILYSKKGTTGSKKLEGGRTAYFFYWGRDSVLWADRLYGAVLLEVATWQFKVPD